MPSIDSTPQSDALAEQLSAAPPLPEAALRAVQGVRVLEAEVMQLRRTLAALPAASRDRARRDELACLLGKVLLFRLALAGRDAAAPATQGPSVAQG